PCEVSGAAHLPAAAARVAAPSGAVGAMTALRLEGVPASITHRRQLLEAGLNSYGRLAVLAAAESQTLWQAIGDVMPFAAGEAASRPLWRISTAPAAGAELGKAIVAETDGELLYDWAGGLIWLTLPPQDDAGAGRLRRALRQY